VSVSVSVIAGSPIFGRAEVLAHIVSARNAEPSIIYELPRQSCYNSSTADDSPAPCICVPPSVTSIETHLVSNFPRIWSASRCNEKPL
jgi:hypothetical protein